MPIGELDPGYLPLSVMKGDDYCNPVQIVDEDGEPFNFSGYTIYDQIKTSQSPDGNEIVAFTINVIDLSIAEFELILTKTQTAAIEEKTGFHAIKLVSPTGFSQTWVIGPVEFTENSTVEPPP